MMAAGGGAGVVTVWNLEERRLHTVIRDAHDAPLLSLHFFPGALLFPLVMVMGTLLPRGFCRHAAVGAELLRATSLLQA